MMSGCHESTIDDWDTSTDAVEETYDPLDEPKTAGWAEIRCMVDEGGMDFCMGLPEGSKDTWVYVLPACELNAREIEDGLVPIGSWLDDSCLPDEEPETFFPSNRCYLHPSNGISACYTGAEYEGVLWFAGSVASCDPALSSVVMDAEPWPEWSCGEAGPTDSPWWRVMCSSSHEACVGWSGNAAHLVRPTCWVEAWTPSPGYLCASSTSV